MAARFAISMMALIGSVAAQGYSNVSTTATASGAAAQYTDGATPKVGGVQFFIQTDITYQGTLLPLSRKRQSNANIGSCLSTCAASTACEGASFVQDTGSCLYYSGVDLDSAAPAPGTDFALVQSRATASGTSSLFNGTTPVTRGPTARPSLPSTNYGNQTTPLGPSRSNGASMTGGVSTRTPTTTSSSAPTSTPSGLITISGVEFLIEINITYSGITIDFEILTKRAGFTLNQCLTTCANNVECAGTAFDSETGDCTFYSSITSGSRRTDVGTTFGTVVYRQNAANGTAPATNVTAESLICPAYNGHVITSSVNTAFSVSCGQFLIGTTFDIKPELMRRQAIDTGLPQTLSNCVDLCSLAESCVGTTFELATETCSYYSDVAYAVALDGFDSATRVQNNDNNEGGEVAPGSTTTVFVAAPTTATVFTTSVTTVYVYAGDATTAFPGGAVVTTVVPVGTTTYTNWVPTANIAIPTITVTAGAGSGAGAAQPTVTVTVDANGNAVNGAAAGAGAAYPTVTVHDTVTYCPQQTTWTTVYV